MLLLTLFSSSSKSNFSVQCEAKSTGILDMFWTYYVCNALLIVGGIVVTSTPEDIGQSYILRYRRYLESEGDPIVFPVEGGCPAPARLLHGWYLLNNWKCPPGNSNPDCKVFPNLPVPDGWNVIFSCDPGYTLNTTIATYTCWEGRWTPPLRPQCVVEQLCQPLKADNGTVKCVLQGKDVSCDTPVKPGTKAILKCNLHYKPVRGPENPQLMCLPNGHWNDMLADCVPACGYSKEAVKVSPLIYNGRDATVGLFPWHAGVYHRKENNGTVIWEQKCGGSLISDQFVLTAAHCVIDRDERSINIALGKYHRSWDHHEHTEAKRGVLKIMYSPEYNRNTYVFDIALVQLDEKIRFGEFIMPVCHGNMDGLNNIQGKNLFIVGWGRTENVIGGPSSETLRYNDVLKVSSKLCRKKSPYFYHSFEKFCVTKANYSVPAALPGDSGGGLTTVFDGLHYIFGIVSQNIDEYSMLTNLTYPHHIMWIEREMKKYDLNFRWIENNTTVLHNRPYYSMKGSGTDCIVPETSTTRKFCSLGEGCEVCDVHHRKCFLLSGSKADSLRVTCTNGYSTGTPDGQVSVCMLDGSWSPPIPECIKTCPPLWSDTLLMRCNYGLDPVNCSDPALPGTTARFLCSPSFLDVLDHASSGESGDIITCQSSGMWSQGNLPSCKPVCGISKEVSTMSPLIVGGVEAHVGAFPWHAGVYFLENGVWEQKCGGSLITDRIVLTASHCLLYAENLSSLRVALGKYYRSWDHDEPTVQKRNVTAIALPPWSSPLNFDIALMLLSEKIKFGEYIMPVCRDFSEGFNYIQNKDLFVTAIALPPWSSPLNFDIALMLLSEKIKFGEYIMPVCRDFSEGFNYIQNKDLFKLNNRYVAPRFCGISKEVSTMSPLIVGGVEAHVGAFPWHAGVYFLENGVWEQKCGGSLITDRIVLTASHCLLYAENLSSLRVALGKYYRSWDHDEPTVQKRNVTAIALPPWSSPLNFDIALMLLSEKIKFGEYIMPVCRDFSEGFNYIQNKDLFASGWGRTNDGGGELSDRLLYNTVSAAPFRECDETFSYFPMNERFCGIENNGSAYSIFQDGDRGAGLTTVFQDGLHYIVGVTSTEFSVPWIEVKYNMFTNISWPSHIIWIENEIRKFQETYDMCHPLESDSLILTCKLGSKIVDCSKRALPGTTASFRCSTRSAEFPELASSDAYNKIIKCKSSGRWSEESLPSCKSGLTEMCRPLVSHSLLLRCTLGFNTIDCSKPAQPGTTLTFQCSPSFTEIPELVSSGAYRKVITCQSSGSWSDENLPSCKPICGVSKHVSTHSPPTVNGVEAQHGDFPWHALIYFRRENNGVVSWNQECAGSLITNRIVVTVAHCVDDVKDLSSMRVALGKHSRSWNREEHTAEIRNVSAITVQEDYNKNIRFFDIALVLLSEKININEFIMPVCRPFPETWHYIENNSYFTPGWGVTDEKLLYTSMKPLPNEECLKIYILGGYEKICFDKNFTVSDKIPKEEDNEEERLADELKDTLPSLLPKFNQFSEGNQGGGLTGVFKDGLHYILGIANYDEFSENLSVFTNTTWSIHGLWIEQEIRHFNNYE